MDRDMDFTGFSSFDARNNCDPNMMNADPMFNPMMQYEQAYMYYRYLTMQLDYKIKCKEYEKVCGKSDKDRRIE